MSPVISLAIKTLSSDVRYIFTGDMFEIGADSGRYYSLNVPLREGIDDASKFEKFFLASHKEWR